jgi:hypothetical protein
MLSRKGGLTAIIDMHYSIIGRSAIALPHFRDGLSQMNNRCTQPSTTVQVAKGKNVLSKSNRCRENISTTRQRRQGGRP